MSELLPIYSIDQFQAVIDSKDLYANHFSKHVKDHHFTNLPHKHDFYLFILITKGSGWHEIDFVRNEVVPGSVFTLRPGQMHFWELSDDIEGYVFFHSKIFYDQFFNGYRINDFPFFSSFQQNSEHVIATKKIEKISFWMEELISETLIREPDSRNKNHVLITLIYIELARGYVHIEKEIAPNYLSKLYAFEKEIERSYKTEKSIDYYADKLALSARHLNRIVRTCLNKTSGDLIADRVILEAKRMLIQTTLNVNEIGYELGYFDRSYFVRFFKKQTGETPISFLKRYKSGAQQ